MTVQPKWIPGSIVHALEHSLRLPSRGGLALEPAAFADRADAGRKLAAMFGHPQHEGSVVIGLAHGGIVTAAALARELGLSLDVVAVAEVRHPGRPGLVIGAVAPDGEVALDGIEALRADELDEMFAQAKRDSSSLDARLRLKYGRLNLTGREIILVDEAITSGAAMVAAAKWGRHRGAARVVAATPVASVQGLKCVLGAVTETACLHMVEELPSVAAWYRSFPEVDIGTAVDVIATSRGDRRESVPARVPR